MISCSTGRYMQLTEAGESAFNEGNYQNALESLELIISEVNGKGKKAEGKVYALAGKSAFELAQYNKALNYLENAQQSDYSDESVYLYLAKSYQQIDNLSKEIGALEIYLQKYPDGNEINTVRTRLFQTCSESENWELGMSLWPLLDDKTKEDISMLESYLIINDAQNKKDVCKTLANQILKRDDDNEMAMKWFGEYYYWKAENRYKAELDAYEKKKTRSQYAKLLEAFKTVTADFKKSLSYFAKLYQKYPDPEYAKYLGDIYARLNDKEKAKYYHSKAK